MKLRKMIGMGAVVITAAVTTACRKEAPPRPKASASANTLPSALRSAQLAPSAAPAPPAPLPPSEQDILPALQQVVERWNRATNEGDGKVLAELYAARLGLYGRMLTREQAVERKLEALRKSPGFTQSINEPAWTERRYPDQEASFLKTSGAAGKVRTVRAYLLLHQEGNVWRILDEGDAGSRRSKRDVGSERSFRCDCQLDFAANPDEPEAPPAAMAPLGPAKVVSAVEPPPGAPKVIEYASLAEDRFAMSNDVPLFVTVTNLSTNGDGRWFFFELPVDAGPKQRVLDCSHGGFWYDGAAPGAPDPAYPKQQGMKSTESLRRDAEGIHYQKTLYAPDGIESHLECKIDPRYEAYFMPIVRRAGATLRAESGGQYARTPTEKRP